MKQIYFCDKYGLTQAVIEGRKTMTRAPLPDYAIVASDPKADLIKYSKYKIGEIVSVAQPYKDVGSSLFEDWEQQTKWFDAGFVNKMLTKADRMPHHLFITEIKVEKLQDISDKDCLKEGIFQTRPTSPLFGWDSGIYYGSPRDAFAAMINGILHNGLWESNPWMFCYEFEKID